MKKIIALCLVTILLLSALYGCGKNDSDKGKISVVTTIFPIYDWVTEILGERTSAVDVTMLLDDGVDLHSYQPTTDEMIKITSCDLFIYVGGESDEWVEGVLKNKTNENMITVNLMDELCGEHDEAGDVDNTEHEHDHEDEHIWLSLKKAKEACYLIEEKLSTIDGEHKDVYASNLSAYTAKIDELDGRYAQTVREARIKTVVFVDRFPFERLCKDYGIEYVAAFSGCSTETNADPQTIKELSDKINELELKYVMALEKTTLGDFADTVINATASKNAMTVTVNSMQSITAKDVSDGADYLAIMENNLTSFAKVMK